MYKDTQNTQLSRGMVTNGSRGFEGSNSTDTVATVNILLEGDREPNRLLIFGKQLLLRWVLNRHSLSLGLK